MAKARVGASGRVVGVDVNASMLDIAKSVAAEREIEWIEADVGAIPLRDDSFDIAYCQQGLQFFSDKVGALREIKRLLRSGGSCLVVVARSLDRNPLMQSQTAALAKHIGADAAAGIRAVCGLANGDDIGGLFASAGFTEIDWDGADLTLTCPDGRAFVKNGILSTLVAGMIANWSDDARGALVDDILDGFGDYFDGRSLSFPHVSSVVYGKKP